MALFSDSKTVAIGAEKLFYLVFFWVSPSLFKFCNITLSCLAILPSLFCFYTLSYSFLGYSSVNRIFTDHLSNLTIFPIF
jgi:hypothetical protein